MPIGPVRTSCSVFPASPSVTLCLNQRCAGSRPEGDPRDPRGTLAPASQSLSACWSSSSTEIHRGGLLRTCRCFEGLLWSGANDARGDGLGKLSHVGVVLADSLVVVAAGH